MNLLKISIILFFTTSYAIWAKIFCFDAITGKFSIYANFSDFMNFSGQVENFKFLEIKKETGGHIQILNIPWPGLAALIFVFSLPFLLAHAFNTEWKSETHYQMFALPVSQYTMILAKIAAVASKGIVGGVIVTIGLSLWAERQAALPNVKIWSDGETEVTVFFDFALIVGLVLVTYMIFIFGVVTGMEGVKFAVKRYRGLTAVAFFLLSTFLYGRLFQPEKFIKKVVSLFKLLYYYMVRDITVQQ